MGGKGMGEGYWPHSSTLFDFTAPFPLANKNWQCAICSSYASLTKPSSKRVDTVGPEELDISAVSFKGSSCRLDNCASRQHCCASESSASTSSLVGLPLLELASALWATARFLQSKASCSKSAISFSVGSACGSRQSSTSFICSASANILRAKSSASNSRVVSSSTGPKFLSRSISSGNRPCATCSL